MTRTSPRVNHPGLDLLCLVHGDGVQHVVHVQGLQPGDAQGNVEGQDGGYVQDVELVPEELQFVRTRDQADDVLNGEPDNGQSLQHVNESILHHRTVFESLLTIN